MTEPIRKPSRAAPAKNGKPRARSRTTNGVPPDVRLNGRRRTGPAPNELALAPAQADEIRNGRTNGRATKAAKPKPAAAPAARPKPAAAPAARPKPAAAPAAKPKPKPARPTPAKSPPDVWDERVAGALRFVRRRLTGEYEVDEFGFDPEFTETFIHPMLRVFKERYFRIETTGVEHLPRDSAALIVANHSGTLPMDALMLGITVHDESPNHRHLRLLGADLVFRIPILSELARKSGSTLACNPDVERLLRSDELVGVFPEGFKGIGKPYRDRYKLQRFGRGGFVSAALRTGTPIIPASIVGAEEIYPIIANVRPLAKMTGLPYVPVTPLFPWLGPLGLLPLPSKWLIEFGEPIKTAELSADADDPIVVFNLADQVRETIQQTLHEMLKRRPDAFA